MYLKNNQNAIDPHNYYMLHEWPTTLMLPGSFLIVERIHYTVYAWGYNFVTFPQFTHNTADTGTGGT